MTVAEREETVQLRRTVTEIGPEHGAARPKSRPISDFRSARAYVLLGDPGAGKTTVFQEEAERVGGLYLAVRRFLRPCRADPERENKTLFLDGLDEMPGMGHGRVLDALLRRLHSLGSPRVRIACRAADWLTGDHDEVCSLDGYEKVQLLQLDPLDASAARKLLRFRLRSWRGADDPRAADDFLGEARERGLSALLGNPLSLRLLAVAVKNGWPSTRREAFEKACLRLAGEHNAKVRACRRDAVSPKVVVAAASRLSALLLLSGKEGVLLDREDGPDNGWLGLDEVGAAPRGGGDATLGRPAFEDALASQLFAVHRPGLFVPVHGQVAAFLAAQQLARTVDDGLPATRALALTRGGDGGIVSPLRGLAAWLASLCPSASAPLIDADPVGVLAYGDAAALTDEDQRRLLRRLGERSKELRRDPWAYSDLATSDLASPAMIGVLRDRLKADDRSEGAQTVVQLVLEGVEAARERSASLPQGAQPAFAALSDQSAKEELIAVARDTTWAIAVRTAALKVVGAPCEDSAGDAAEIDASLEELLHDLAAGRVADDDRDLQGALLGCLYPRRIPPEDIWRHLDAWHDGSRLGGSLYGAFWEEQLLRQTQPEDVPALLDALCAESRSADSRPSWFAPPRTGRGRPSWFSRLAWRMVAAACDLRGDGLPASKLYDWLEFAAYSPETGWDDEHERQERVDDRLDDAYRETVSAFAGDFELMAEDASAARERTPIRALKLWLAQRPNVQYGLLLEFFERNRQPGFDALAFRTLVLGRASPADFPRWCLDQALAKHDSWPEASRDLIAWAVAPLRAAGPPAGWLPQMEKAVAGRAALADHLREIARRDDEDEARRREAFPAVAPQGAALAATAAGASREGSNSLAEWARSQKESLLRGEASPDLLDALARAYLGHFGRERAGGSGNDARADGMDCLRRALNDDEALAWAAAGLRRVLDRTRLPSADDLIRWDEQGKWSLLARPVLASVDIAISNEDALARMGAEALRMASACRLLETAPMDPPPSWFLRAIESRPDDVADALVAIHRSLVRTGRLRVQHLASLRRHPSYAKVAMAACPRLLEAFPTRCNGAQVAMLRQVLLAAVRRAPNQVLERVRNRVGARGMDSAQASTWLAAGVLVAPGEFAARAVGYMAAGRGNARARHMTALLAMAWDRSERPGLGEPVGGGATETAALLGALARRFQPWWLPVATSGHGTGVLGSRDPDMETPDLVIGRLMEALARDPAPEASTALDSLLADADDALAAWRAPIESTRDQQTALRRDTEHRAPSVDEVQEVLKNGRPAGAADLAALVVDRMRTLGRRIRDGDTSDWKQYWNLDVHGRPTKPRPENACRDAFLSDLKTQLPEGVSAMSEQRRADDARADIVCKHDGLEVPVEAKTSASPDLWSAVKSQLVEKYARSPESGGHGIYLVFWFGKGRAKAPPAEGRAPKTAAELQAALEQRLPPAQRDRISVVVVDIGGGRSS